MKNEARHLTAQERRELDRFIKHVDKKVAQIEHNVKALIGIKEFERRQRQMKQAKSKRSMTRGRS